MFAHTCTVNVGLAQARPNNMHNLNYRSYGFQVVVISHCTTLCVYNLKATLTSSVSVAIAHNNVNTIIWHSCPFGTL